MSEENGLMKLEDWTTPDPRRYEVVEVQGRKVRIRSLHAGDVVDVDIGNYRTNGKVDLHKTKDTKFRYIVASVVNANNETYLTVGHCAALRKKDSLFITDLYEKIAEFSGLNKDTLEDHEKNSEPASVDGSQ